MLALIFVVPALINVDRYRPQVISYLQEKTGMQVEIGRQALTFFPVTIHIDHIGVKNPPIFPAGYVAGGADRCRTQCWSAPAPAGGHQVPRT